MNRVSEMNLVDIDKLIPYVNNARTHSKEQINKLRASIREFGFINPVIMLMYGKEASNQKQEIDRQHYTIPNQRPKDKHCGKI